MQCLQSSYDGAAIKKIVNIRYYPVESLTYHTTPDSLRESVKMRWFRVVAKAEPTVKKKGWFTVTFENPMNTCCLIICWVYRDRSIEIFHMTSPKRAYPRLKDNQPPC